MQCSLVSSCTAATAPAPPRQRETTTVDAQRGPRGGICAPGLSSPHSSACDKWDVDGQWNACPVRCFWCCIARPVAAPSLAHNHPAAPAVQSSRLCNHLISKAAGGLSQRPLYPPHASATTRLAGFGCCSAVCLTSGHDPFWRNLCGHPSQACSQVNVEQPQPPANRCPPTL